MLASPNNALPPHSGQQPTELAYYTDQTPHICVINRPYPHSTNRGRSLHELQGNLLDVAGTSVQSVGRPSEQGGEADISVNTEGLCPLGHHHGSPSSPPPWLTSLPSTMAHLPSLHHGSPPSPPPWLTSLPSTMAHLPPLPSTMAHLPPLHHGSPPSPPPWLTFPWLPYSRVVLGEWPGHER